MDAVSEKNDLLSGLLACDRRNLLNIGTRVNALFRLHGSAIWQRMDNVILELIRPLSFDRIVKKLPASLHYHRLSLSRLGEPLDVVFLVFKVDKNDGAAVLINTYDSREPNDRTFSANNIINNSSAEAGHILIQTPAHSHKATCHNCVAWIKNNVTVSEQFYKLNNNDTLQLINNVSQNMHQCGFDNSHGNVIHRISVDFGPAGC